MCKSLLVGVVASGPTPKVPQCFTNRNLLLLGEECKYVQKLLCIGRACPYSCLDHGPRSTIHQVVLLHPTEMNESYFRASDLSPTAPFFSSGICKETSS